jgi:hypothetical protein
MGRVLDPNVSRRRGVENLVMASSSIEVNRRRAHPERTGEQRRQPHREPWTLKRDRTRVTSRIAGSLP